MDRAGTPAPRLMRLLGVDFTSAPTSRKPITAARGTLCGTQVQLSQIDCLADWPAFETLLAEPGPWLGAFDFPFGLPREAVRALGWPTHWAGLTSHCQALGRPAFRAALDRYRESRPVGQRYAHRRTDHPAGSHSPLKLVNPPVALMFLEGAPRLLKSGVTVAGMHPGDPQRIAVEAYPGVLARALGQRSYKSDARARQTPARRDARATILARLVGGSNPLGLQLSASPALLARMLEEPTGDQLDATLALLQAAWCLARADASYGLPADLDPLEGWIATV